MKYAFFLIISFISIVDTVSARTVTSFKKSDALTSIAEFLYEASGDLHEHVKISDRKISSVNYKECKLVTSDIVLDEILTSIKHVIRYYPDEDLPFEEAITDLENYLDYQVYHVCNFIKRTKHSTIYSLYFVNTTDRIHVRVDKITPVLD